MLLERPDVPEIASTLQKKRQAIWMAFGSTPARVIIGLLMGVGLLFVASRFIDVVATLGVLEKNLTTPRGLLLALLSGVAFLLAYSIRGIRWRLFLNPIGKISPLRAIQLFLISIFLNFLMPVQGGEVSKSLILKRIAGIPVSQSLPTIALDRALDLLPALIIIILVPVLGLQMDIKLWIVLGFVASLFMVLLCFVVLAAYRRSGALSLLHTMTTLLPKSIGRKCEGFAVNFVDSLLLGISRPRIFLPAVLLTGLAVSLDGLYITLAFWTIGYPISFGTVLFGYTLYNLFYILPNPPGQIGSNEAVGLLVFSGLLHLPANKVAAMILFAHPWSALLMCMSGSGCLSALGLTMSSALRLRTEDVPLPEAEKS